MFRSLPVTLAALLLGAPLLHAQSSDSHVTAPPVQSNGSGGAGGKITPTALYPNYVQNIYCGFGITTVLELKTKTAVDSIQIGFPIVKVKYEPTLHTVSIFPTVTSGSTNMVISIGGVNYVFVLSIVNDGRVQYLRTFTIPSETDSEDDALVGGTKPLKPAQIDIVGAIKVIEQARVDPVFKAEVPNFRTMALGIPYQWNNNIIYLVDASEFLAQDLIVLKVQWQNQSNKAYYLDVSQYQVWIANKQIPVTARTQDRQILMPGETDTAYLFIQGYKLNINNNWSLKLPPEADAVRRLFQP
jgi:hypothetical protein